MTNDTVDHKQLHAFSEIRVELCKQGVNCPVCKTEQVQLVDYLKDPLFPQYKCRSCYYRFAAPSIISVETLLDSRHYWDYVMTVKVLIDPEGAEFTGKPCERGCCFTSNAGRMKLSGQLRYPTPDEMTAYNVAKNILKD